MPRRGPPIESLAESLYGVYPELREIGAAGAGPVYLVGGAVRDLLLGRGRADLDLAVVGDPAALAGALGATMLSQHDRFGTAKVELDGHEIDLAAARTESYPHPGSLPVVAAAESIEADLGRRDFSLNAIAISLSGPVELIDPHGGRADLEAGQLRILHPRLLPRRPDPRDPRRPLRVPLRLHPRARDRVPAAPRRPRHRLRGARASRAAAPGRRSDRAARLRAARRSGAWSSCARAASTWPPR